MELTQALKKIYHMKKNLFDANWEDFQCPRAHENIQYTLFIVDAIDADNATQRSGWNASSLPNHRCRDFLGVPQRDVIEEAFLLPTTARNVTYSNSTDKLRCGHHYFMVVEACDAGGCIFSNSNGFDLKCGGDDDLAPYKAGLIAMGCALCCLLLLLLLLIIVVAKGKGDDKYTTTVHRNENVDKL